MVFFTNAEEELGGGKAKLILASLKNEVIHLIQSLDLSVF